MASSNVIIEQVINRILDTKDISFIQEHDITVDYFLGYEDEYYFIMDHYDKYHTVPDKITFADEFEDFNFFEVNESDQYLYDSLFELYYYNYIADSWDSIRDMVSQSPMQAMEKFQTLLSNAPKTNSEQGIDIIANALDRVRLIEERKNSEKSYYIKTGFEELDASINGWARGEEFVVIFGRTGHGKEQPLSSKILTPYGWKTMGEIKLNDDIFSGTGDICKVIGIFPQGLKKVYRVTFNDNTYVDCGLEHLWKVQNAENRDKNSFSLLTLKELINTNFHDFNIPKNPVIFYNERNDRIDSKKIYSFGNLIAFKLLVSKYKNFHEENLRIPDNILYGTYDDRFSFIHGFLDLGGFLKNKRVYCRIRDKLIRSQIVEIIRSLGGFVIENKSLLEIYLDKNPFLMNSELRENWVYNEIPLKFIKNIKFNRIENCQCIMVDHEDHTYITDNFTVTHNTWILLKTLVNAFLTGNRVGFISPEMSAEKIGFRFDTLNKGFSNKDLTSNKIVEDEINFNKYKTYIQELSETNNAFIVASMKDFDKKLTVSKLRSFIIKNNLDIVGIDGLTYMSDEKHKKGDNKTVMLTNISEDLITLSNELKIPILVAVQSNRGGVIQGEEGTPEIENIRDSDGIAQNATKVISIRQNVDKIDLAIKKHRDGKFGETFSYYWDANVGSFEFTSLEKERMSYKGNKESRNIEEKQIQAQDKRARKNKKIRDF